MMTARFGRSPVRIAAYDLLERCPGLDLSLSWLLFASLEDWGKRWPAEQGTFSAGLILSAADDPVVERAVGRCLADLARQGRPLLWGTVDRRAWHARRIRWQSQFMLSPNGWPPELILPYPAEYARLGVANDTPEFCPLFDPILYSGEADFSISSFGLQWWEPRHFHRVIRDGKVIISIGCPPGG
jgi:hypothetical protein